MNPNADTESFRSLQGNLSYEAIERPSTTDNRAPLRGFMKPAKKRVFSLATKRNKFHIENVNHCSPHDEEFRSKSLDLAMKIPNTLDQETGRSMQELAMEDLKGQSPKDVLNILEEYTKIPRTIRIATMLTIAADRRASIRKRVLQAKMSLIAKIHSTHNDEDRGIVHLQRLQSSSPQSKDSMTAGIYSSHPAHNSLVYNPISKCIENESCPINLSKALQTRRYVEGLEFNNYAHDIYEGVLGCAAREEFARLASEAGVSSRHAPITSAIIEAITTSKNLASSRTPTRGIPETKATYASQSATSFGLKVPSRENPFASFITEKSDSEAAKLPTELRLCYDAHNQVQDQLRHMRRQNKESSTAEEVAGELWGRLLNKDFEVSSDDGGTLGEMKSLNHEKLVYVWVMRFLERCKAEGW